MSQGRLGTMLGDSSFLSPLVSLGSRRSPFLLFSAASLVYLSLLVTLVFTWSQFLPPKAAEKRRWGLVVWEGAVEDGVGPDCLSAGHRAPQARMSGIRDKLQAAFSTVAPALPGGPGWAAA